MGLTDTLRAILGLEYRAAIMPPPMTGFDNLWPYINFDGNTYPLGMLTSMPGSKAEEISDEYDSLVAQGFRSNAIIFACELTRIQVFSQARFQWQALRKGQPDNLFGTPALDILQHPWHGGTTGDLLTRMLIHADFAGNSFVTRRPDGRLRCLRPNWVSMVLGSYDDPDMTSDDLDAEFLGIIYYPGGKRSGQTPVALLREQVAHFAPIPDPQASYRGMSWLSPVIREIMGDSSATAHKLKFFENAGTPNLIVKRDDAPAKEAFLEWMTMMEQGHAGIANAYKTLYLTAGADATVVGRDLQQLDFKVVQGAGETRIAAAAGTHPVIVGLSEGMQGSSLNAGNFNSARRLMADKTLWHLWSNVAGSLETIVPPPTGSRLWVDDKIPFLREDRKDAAEIQQLKAATIRQLVDAGYTADSVVKAVDGEDMTQLKHSGLFSVQLQPAGTPLAGPTTQPTNGTKPAAGAMP